MQTRNVRLFDRTSLARISNTKYHSCLLKTFNDINDEHEKRGIVVNHHLQCGGQRVQIRVILCESRIQSGKSHSMGIERRELSWA